MACLNRIYSEVHGALTLNKNPDGFCGRCIMISDEVWYGMRPAQGRFDSAICTANQVQLELPKSLPEHGEGFFLGWKEKVSIVTPVINYRERLRSIPLLCLWNVIIKGAYAADSRCPLLEKDVRLCVGSKGRHKVTREVVCLQ